MEETRRLEKRGEASLATRLADEQATAWRAVGWARAVSWGTRALWGGACCGALASGLGANANVLGAITLTSLILAFGLGAAAFGRTNKSGASGTRSRATSAARRLECRFPEQTGVLVAAVDFCSESATERNDVGTSADLRAATIAAASRFLATAASEMDLPTWRAALTGEKSELFRNLRKKTRIGVLGVWANLALWGGAALWEGDGAPKGGTFLATGEEIGKVDRRLGENKENGGNEEGGTIAKVGEDGLNEEPRDDEMGSLATVDEPGEKGEILTALEVLIADLAQNAEIAEFFQAELETAAERTSAEKNEPLAAASEFLQLARELNANLTRPKTGILAQVRRLEAILRREETLILKRLDEMGEGTGIKGIGSVAKASEIGGIEEIKGEGEREKEKNGVAGTEIALLLLLSRLDRIETEFCVAETEEIASSLKLSVLLRSGSAVERKKTLEGAARRVGEWGATLRREAAVAQILRESWTFDATSQAWRRANERAWKKNQTLLARFAGRLASDDAASNGDDVAFEKAKKGALDAWRETRSLEKERFAIFARLLKRLQTEEAQGRSEFLAGENDGDADVAEEKIAWDAAVFNAADVASKRAAERELRVTEALENNRFGDVAEELRRGENRLKIEPQSSGKIANKREDEEREGEERDKRQETEGENWSSDWVNVADKEVAEETEVGEEEEGDEVEERRFAFWAARLTFGVDGETARGTVAQLLADQRVGERENADERAVWARRGEEKDGEERGENDLTPRQDESENATAEYSKNDATSLKDAERTNAEKKLAEEDVNGDKTIGCERDEEAELTQELTQNLRSENDATSRVGAKENRDGDESNGGEAEGSGTGLSSEKSDAGAQVDESQAFTAEIPPEVRRRFEGTSAPEILPEYAEKIRLYRRRITGGK